MSKRSRPPTMADIAKAVGVSTMTVSRAFKADASVKQPTREAILEMAEQLGYVLDNTAAGLSSRRTGFIAVTIPSINNANFADTVRGLVETLRGTGLQILLGYTNYDVEEEERLVEQFLTRRPEAIVVTGGTHTSRCRRMLENAAIPVVEIWDLPRDPIDRVVGFSNAGVGKLMAGHFRDRGYTKLGFIGGDASRDTRGHDRYHGYAEALREQGLNCERLVASNKMPVSMREGACSMRELFERWPDTEAVMCVSDLTAFGAVTECLRMGLRIPDDIAIAGFGAFEVAECSVPSITTIDVHAQDIGEQAADIILRSLAMEGLSDIPLISRVQPRLIVRETTGSDDRL